MSHLTGPHTDDRNEVAEVRLRHRPPDGPKPVSDLQLVPGEPEPDQYRHPPLLTSSLRPSPFRVSSLRPRVLPSLLQSLMYSAQSRLRQRRMAQQLPIVFRQILVEYDRSILRSDKEHPAVEEPMEIRPQYDAVFDALFAAFRHRPKVRCIQRCPRRLLADYTPFVLFQNVVSESTFPLPLFSGNPQSWSACDIPLKLIDLVRIFTLPLANTRPARLICFRISLDNNPVFSIAILTSILTDISQEVPVLLILCVLDHNFEIIIISLFERAFHLPVHEYFHIRKPLFRLFQIIDLIGVQMVRIDIQTFRLFPTLLVFPPYDDRHLCLLR